MADFRRTLSTFGDFEAEFEPVNEGFNFDNCKRNDMLSRSKGMQKLKAMKTGTTICGVVYEVSFSIFRSKCF